MAVPEGLYTACGTQPCAEHDTTMHWAVEVRRNGDNILTIESNMLAGKGDLTAEDERVIRQCADHLLSFIGGNRIPPAEEPSAPEKGPDRE